MPLASVLREQAVIFAASLKNDLVDLRIEKQVLEASPKTQANVSQLKLVLDQIGNVEAGLARLHEYNPEIARPFECPYCWIIQAERTPLSPAEGQVIAAACPSCAAEYQLD